MLPFEGPVEEVPQEPPPSIWAMITPIAVVFPFLFLMIYFPAFGLFISRYIAGPLHSVAVVVFPLFNLLIACAIVAPALMTAIRLGRHPQSILLLAFAGSIFVVFFTKDETALGLLLSFGTPFVLAWLASQWQPWWLIVLATSTVPMLLLERTSAEPELPMLLDWLLIPLLLFLLLVAWLKQSGRW
jgi:hypothetical protein